LAGDLAGLARAAFMLDFFAGVLGVAFFAGIGSRLFYRKMYRECQEGEAMRLLDNTVRQLGIFITLRFQVSEASRSSVRHMAVSRLT
jgi:hypothetical protein